MGNQVIMWCRGKAVVDSINQKQINSKYLSQFSLSPNLTATQELTLELFNSVTVVLIAIPTQHCRSVLEQIKDWVTVNHLLIFVNKGIETSTGLLPCDIAIEVFGQEIGGQATFLSGPSFAVEVVAKQPTAVSVASKNIEMAHRAQRLFHAPHFRVYYLQDTMGIEIAGALKNVIAVASGACTGVGFQMNARAAIITRGLAEITRFGVAMGANPLTFSGLSGVGDLFLTCTSEKSRNFTVGYRIGKGEKLPDIIASLGSVAEGVPTTKAAFELAQKLGIEAPITKEIYQVLYQDKPLEQAIKDLIERDPNAELYGIME